jgi:hypothetical protein
MDREPAGGGKLEHVPQDALPSGWRRLELQGDIEYVRWFVPPSAGAA